MSRKTSSNEINLLNKKDSNKNHTPTVESINYFVVFVKSIIQDR